MSLPPIKKQSPLLPAVSSGAVSPAPRTAGGATTLVQKRPAAHRNNGHSVADVPPHPNERQRRLMDQNRQMAANGAARLRTTTGAAAASSNTIRVMRSDVERGAWSMIERGLVPANFDMGLVVMEAPPAGGRNNNQAGAANLAAASPLQCGALALRQHDEQFVRQQIATGAAAGGGTGYLNVRYDVRELEDMPHDRAAFMAALDAKKTLRAMEPTPQMKLAARTAAGRRQQMMAMAGANNNNNRVDADKLRDQRAGILSPTLNGDAAGALLLDANGKEREPTRTYEEILDQFSLHDFIIRKGVTLRNTPEFSSFHRSNVQKWSAVNDIILHLERLLHETAVPVANINGNRVVELATVDNGICTKEQLLSCIVNRDEIEPLITSLSHRFLFAPRRFDLAASIIQAAFRGFHQFKLYKLLHAANAAAIKIQHQYAVHRLHKETQRRLKLDEDALLDAWRRVQERFVSNWPLVSRSRRVVVHVPSISVGSEHRVPVFADYFQRQILPRLASLVDSNIDYMVVVLPVKPEPDTVHYFMNVLASAGLDPTRLEGRLVLFVPEIISSTLNQRAAGEPRRSRVTLPALTLSKLTLCSSDVLRKLKAAVRGRTAYMVCDVVTNDEQFLAAKLGIPILGVNATGSPAVPMQLSTKSGARLALGAADVNIPVGAVGIRTPDDLYLALSKLIVENPTVLRWIIKLDAESGGRGIAVLDTKRIRSFDEVAKLFEPQPGQSSIMSPAASASAHSSAAGVYTPATPTIGAATAVAAKIYGELKEVAARRIKLSHSAAYADWNAFTAAMKKMSAVVEAAPNDIVGSPVAHLFIPPHTVNSGGNNNNSVSGSSGSGGDPAEPQLLGVQQQIVSPLTFCSLGVVYPQTCVPEQAIVDASLNVARVLRKAGLVGYVSIDFVVFKKPPVGTAAGPGSQQQQQAQQSQQQQQQQQMLRMWTVGIRPCLTINSSIHEFACVLRHERMSVAAAGDISFRSSNRPPFCYAYTGIVYHPHIAALRHSTFFQIARQRGLSYEPESTPGFQEVCALAAANGETIMGGTVFHLIDSLLCGAVGALFLGPTPKRCAELFVRFTELLHQQLSAENALLDDPRGNLLHLLASARTFTVMYNLQKKPAAASAPAAPVKKK